MNYGNCARNRDFGKIAIFFWEIAIFCRAAILIPSEGAESLLRLVDSSQETTAMSLSIYIIKSCSGAGSVLTPNHILFASKEEQGKKRQRNHLSRPTRANSSPRLGGKPDMTSKKQQGCSGYLEQTHHYCHRL